MRGGFASKPIEHLLAEAEQLAADGARELVLIAQDTSSYGLDLYYEPRLAELIVRLGEIEGPAWIRLMYLYPTHITDELIDVVASHEKVVPYLDLPLQHIADEILERMRRRVTRAETEALLDRLRGRIDSLVLRTTLMTGFPGETDRHFDELLQFVRTQRFERLGVFAFSEEPGTGAMHLDGTVPEPIRESRRELLMAEQQEIAFEFARRQVGQTVEVLVDRDIPGEEHAYVGRTYADAPEVDGAVYVTGEDLAPGQIVACEIVASREYDLIGISTK